MKHSSKDNKLKKNLHCEYSGIPFLLPIKFISCSKVFIKTKLNTRLGNKLAGIRKIKIHCGVLLKSELLNRRLVRRIIVDRRPDSMKPTFYYPYCCTFIFLIFISLKQKLNHVWIHDIKFNLGEIKLT